VDRRQKWFQECMHDTMYQINNHVIKSLKWYARNWCMHKAQSTLNFTYTFHSKLENKTWKTELPLEEVCMIVHILCIKHAESCKEKKLVLKSYNKHVWEFFFSRDSLNVNENNTQSILNWQGRSECLSLEGGGQMCFLM
jgi:hypothetical protein